MATGETIVTTDPPVGFVNPADYPGIDRFTVTFDADNYVYIDEIIVDTDGATPPVVIKTRRLDNGEPDTVEIVLDRPMPIGKTTTFTFNDGTTENVVVYTLRSGPVPTVSHWGLVVLSLLLLTAASVILRRFQVVRRQAAP